MTQTAMYKGRDGREYHTSEALREANRRWVERTYVKIPGRDLSRDEKVDLTKFLFRKD